MILIFQKYPGNYPLVQAIHMGNVGMIKALTSEPIDPEQMLEIQTENRESPLVAAVGYINEEEANQMVEILLQAGFNPDTGE